MASKWCVPFRAKLDVLSLGAAPDHYRMVITTIKSSVPRKTFLFEKQTKDAMGTTVWIPVGNTPEQREFLYRRAIEKMFNEPAETWDVPTEDDWSGC